MQSAECGVEDPKSEWRNPKEGRNPKSEGRGWTAETGLGMSALTVGVMGAMEHRMARWGSGDGAHGAKIFVFFV